MLKRNTEIETNCDQINALADKIDAGFKHEQRYNLNRLDTINNLAEYQKCDGLSAMGLANKTEYFQQRLVKLGIKDKTFYRWWNAAEYAVKREIEITEKNIASFMAIADVAEDKQDVIFDEGILESNKPVPPAQMIRDANKALKSKVVTTDSGVKDSAPHQAAVSKPSVVSLPSEKFERLKSEITHVEELHLYAYQDLLNLLLVNLESATSEDVFLGKSELSELLELVKMTLLVRTPPAEMAAAA